MSTSEPEAGERITGVRVTEDSLSIDLLDGRSLTVPLAWSPRLLDASEAQRNHFRITGGGFVIHWPTSTNVDPRKGCWRVRQLQAHASRGARGLTN